MSRAFLPRIRYVGTGALFGVGTLGWLTFGAVAYLAIALGARETGPPTYQHYDWHVYAAGGRDLLERTLYREPLHLDGYAMPVAQYNMPPFSALLAVPLLWLPIHIGGAAWQVISAAMFGLSAPVLASMLSLRPAWAWGGLAVGVYAFDRTFASTVILGNLNLLMLLLVVGFAALHVLRHDRAAGLVLGLAVSVKLWPIVLALLLVRERRWTSLRWAAGFCIVQGLIFLVWLGPDVLPEMLGAIGSEVPITNYVVGISAMREMYEWWPAWGAIGVAAVLLAVPLDGRAGVGVGILAGLALIPNLWLHYLPTVFVAVSLVTADAVAWLRRIREQRGTGPERRSDPREPQPEPVTEGTT